jgi:phage shock protein A
LIAFGQFAQQHGLIRRLMQVPIDQKTRTFTPQTKLLELLVGTLAGIEYLRDLNDAPHPIAKDPLVAEAWGQAAWAHYSGVSRTLDACDAETVQATQGAIEAFSQPFIDRAVSAELRRGTCLVFDADLMGQPVSPTSTTYPAAAFGWMDDRVQLGYQLARVCVQTTQDGRLWLAGFHHPGDTVSQACLQELVHAAERIARIRPRRRTELIQKRLQTFEQPLVRYARLVQHHEDRLAHLVQRIDRLTAQIVSTEQRVSRAAIIQKSKSARRASRSRPSKTPKRSGVLIETARKRLHEQCASWRKQRERAHQQIQRAEQVIAKHRQKIQALEAERDTLRARLAHLEAENASNPNAPTCLWRMDAGFGSGENIAWLIEMGYAIETKSPNAKTTAALQKRVKPKSPWTRVGANAEMLAWRNYFVNACPYPLIVGLERFNLGRAVEYATLIAYRDDPGLPDLPSWFQEYNGRQTIEAGNKEMKGTFKVQHLMSRSLPGIQLQVLFAGLAPNLVRWSSAWLREQLVAPTPKVTAMLSSVKTMVRIGANSPANVQRLSHGASLHFAPSSALPGVVLYLSGQRAYQLALPFNRPLEFSSE